MVKKAQVWPQPLKGCETGPTVYSPYPRRLENIYNCQICGCNYKGSTFPSVILRPWLLVMNAGAMIRVNFTWQLVSLLFASCKSSYLKVVKLENVSWNFIMISWGWHHKFVTQVWQVARDDTVQNVWNIRIRNARTEPTPVVLQSSWTPQMIVQYWPNAGWNWK